MKNTIRNLIVASAALALNATPTTARLDMGAAIQSQARDAFRAAYNAKHDFSARVIRSAPAIEIEDRRNEKLTKDSRGVFVVFISGKRCLENIETNFRAWRSTRRDGRADVLEIINTQATINAALASIRRI